MHPVMTHNTLSLLSIELYQSYTSASYGLDYKR